MNKTLVKFIIYALLNVAIIIFVGIKFGLNAIYTYAAGQLMQGIYFEIFKTK